VCSEHSTLTFLVSRTERNRRVLLWAARGIAVGSVVASARLRSPWPLSALAALATLVICAALSDRYGFGRWAVGVVLTGSFPLAVGVKTNGTLRSQLLVALASLTLACLVALVIASYAEPLGRIISELQVRRTFTAPTFRVIADQEISRFALTRSLVKTENVVVRQVQRAVTAIVAVLNAVIRISVSVANATKRAVVANAVRLGRSMKKAAGLWVESCLRVGTLAFRTFRITLVPVAAGVEVMALVLSAADRILAYILHGTTRSGLLPGMLLLTCGFLVSLVVVLAYAGSNLLHIAYSVWIFVSETVFGAVLFLFVVSSWINAILTRGARKPLHPGQLTWIGTAVLIGLFVYSQGIFRRRSG
jgi:hypothetical protein